MKRLNLAIATAVVIVGLAYAPLPGLTASPAPEPTFEPCGNACNIPSPEPTFAPEPTPTQRATLPPTSTES